MQAITRELRGHFGQALNKKKRKKNNKIVTCRLRGTTWIAGKIPKQDFLLVPCAQSFENYSSHRNFEFLFYCLNTELPTFISNLRINWLQLFTWCHRCVN